MEDLTKHTKASGLRELLKNAHGLLKVRSRFSHILFGIGIFFVLLLFLVLFENSLYLSPVFKGSYLLVVAFISVLTLWHFRKNSQLDDFKNFYRTFSKSSGFNEVNYTLDLEDQSIADPTLVNAAIEQNLSKVDARLFSDKLARYVKEHSITRSFQYSVILILISLSLISISASFLDKASVRAITFWEAFQKPNPFEYSVDPQNITVEQGSTFIASITFKNGYLPEQVSLKLKTSAEDEFRERNMEYSGGTYRSIPLSISNSLQYFVEMDGFQSEVYTVSVQLRPRFSELTAFITPPSYTKLDPTISAYPFSTIRAYQGSEITLKGVLNKKVEEAVFYKNDKSESIEPNQDIFLTQFSVVQRDTIFFDLKDESGLTNRNPFKFVIEPIQDQYPIAELVEPSASFEMIEPQLLNLIYKATDDFEIQKAELRYELRKAYVDEPTKGSNSLSTPVNGVLQNIEWNVGEFELAPLDELSFWIEVTDNDEYNGAKSSRSQVITLTIPSLVDYFEGLDEEETEVETGLEEISDAFEEIEQQYEEFKEALKENPQGDFEQQLQLEEVQKQQEQLEQRIEELNKKFEEIKEELNENSLLSEETREAYEELQKLMEEIDDPAFREALEQMMEQLNQMSPEQMRKAMENFEFNEELYKQRLERTIELFKQLKLMSDMEKLAKAFEDQARQEEELAKNPPNTKELENKRTEDLNQLKKLEEALEKLSENTSQKTEAPVAKLQKEAQQELDDIKKQIEEALKKMQEQSSENGEQQRNSQPQQNQSFQQQYQKLAEKTQQAMQGMQQQQMQINIAGLQYILYSLLNLSNEQEVLVTSTQETESRSLAYVDFARDQKNVELVFKSMSDSLYQLSSEIPQFSNEINKKKLEIENQLSRSIQQMAERDRRNSSVASRQVFGGINELSFMIANLLEQLQNSDSQGGGGGGSMSLQQMIEQMEQMGQNQQQLNQQIQNMINDIQGERLSNDQMDRLNQLAKQQNAIRKQLEEIQRNGGADGDRIGSELERMIEEMEDTINDLRGGAVDPLLIERQQNILSRMLNAEKALQERDEEEKREGKNADFLEQNTPPEITLEELEKQIRSRLNDPNFTKYAPDYQRLIERYFELLKLIQSRQIQ